MGPHSHTHLPGQSDRDVTTFTLRRSDGARTPRASSTIRDTPRLNARHYLLLGLMALVLFVPGRASLPPLDRDESRYMQATSQMLETHNFIDVRFQDQPRYLQPAGIYWLQSASVALLSSAEARQAWAYRMPALIGAVASVLLTAWIGTTLFGTTAGFVAALLLATSVLLSVEARMATIDGTLLAVILTAQSALLKVYLGRDSATTAPRRPAALFWVALGVGLMLKGPVIVLVSFGTILGLVVSERRAAWLRRLHAGWGIPLMLAIVVPWCVAIWVVSHGDFFARSIGHNFLGKVAQGQEAHGLPPGYHLAVFALSFWPGSLFAVLAIPFAWVNRRTPQVRFVLAWIIPTWVTFELVATKLPHYVLPTFPAIACLTAAAALAPGAWHFGRIWRWVAGVYATIWLVVGLGLAVAGPVVLWTLERKISAAPVLAGFAVIPLVAAAPWFAWRNLPVRALACAGLAALLVLVDAYAFVLPDLRTLWLSPRIAAAVAAVRPCPDSIVASGSFTEPSLVFLLGKDTRLVTATAAADYLLAHQACGLALIGSKDAPVFLQRMAAGAATPRPLTQISGINYSTGKKLDLTLYAAQ